MANAGNRRSRTAAQSRCVRPRPNPLEWQDYVDDTDDSVVEFAAWLSEQHPSTQLDLVSRMDALEELASLGEIQIPEDEAPGDLDAIRRDPDIYELRWTLLTKQVRQYHGEPAHLPNHLVRLHLHIKGDTVRRTPDAKARQDAEISTAIVRYHAGRPRDWGIT